MLCTLQEVLQIALEKNQGLAAFNVYGFEDAYPVVKAAEERQAPVVLMTNKAAVDHMGVGILAALLLRIARDSSTHVCVHLDHGTDVPVIREAIEEGYTSVMFDGSQLPFDQNVAITKEVVCMAHARGISVEAEIGAVGFSDPSIEFVARYSNADEAKLFQEHTGIDALAVAVGTVHRMEEQGVALRFDLLREISHTVPVPLVIHGASGVTDGDLVRLIESGARKINLGTVLRIAFGTVLRSQFSQHPKEYDRIKLFPACMQAVYEKALQKITLLQAIPDAAASNP